MDIRNIKSIDDLIIYFTEELNWNIDLDDFDEIDDITYDFDASDIGLKEEAFAKISSLRQLRPLCDEQKWGIFCAEFDSNKFEVSALRKILSGLIPKRRNATEHAVWSQKDLLFLCFWGTDNNRTIGIAHFEDKDAGLPQIKMISCAPAVEDFTQIRTFEDRISHLSWVKDVTDTQAWYEQWSAAFVTAYHQVIRDSASLTVKLAAEAQAIRDRILDIYAVETHDGYVHKLFKDFKDNLIHDMTKQQFADMYAQTVVYGLFSARCMDNKTQDSFNVKEAIACIPNTNPFLKRLMEECLGEGSERHLTFDELEVANVVEILTHTNTDLILQDFNRQTGGGREDPVIHFYEEFLTAYDKAQKVQRGVYYTPQPVVNFIVRAVDSILKTEFGLVDGLASEETKDVMVEVEGKKRRERREVPAVQILDPATGTGTFLRQTILQIYDNFRAKHKGESEEQIRKAWNEYVPKHLLTRLNGFELMMAPYAVAHMKLAMVLKDTGYDFGGDHRLNVFLTNSLEEAGKDDFQMTLFDNDPLAFESIEANQAKNNNGINVIIGNPPYSGESANKGKWIMDLMEDYKKEPGGRIKLQERNPKWLNDDYVKFIRYAQTFIEKSNAGILAFITPNKYMENSTFRGMRWLLSTLFDKIYIVNLHGNSKEAEKNDENVFDIQQGVAISILITTNNHSTSKCEVKYIDISGTREEKYNWLNTNELSVITKNVSLSEPNYFFMPILSTEPSVNDTYSNNSFSTSELFIINSAGVVTSNDKVLIANNMLDLQSNVTKEYGVPFDETIVSPIAYRVFDKRLYYNDTAIIERSRTETMKHMLMSNIGFVTVRKQSQNKPVSYYFLSENPISNGYIRTDTVTIDNLSPLFLYKQDFGKVVREPNLKEKIVKAISNSLKLPFATNSDGGKTDSFAPIDLLDYIYAVLYSPKYREKYKEFLKIDFPRVPYPTDQETFWKLVEVGGKLRECHLMQTKFDTAAYSFVGDGTNEVVKPEYKNGRVYISKTQYFDNVPQAQWEQYIGGYQPLQKWLKDHKKTALSAEDIEHYKKIIAALRLTEELMAEIDQVVEF